MTGSGFSVDELRIGPQYEAVRGPLRARLAAAAPDRRVSLGDDLVLVFETRETMSTALEELLRSERLADPARMDTEARAFGGLLPGVGELAATLYVDVADPVALADRLSELSGVAGAISLEVLGTPVVARWDSDDDLSGAFHLVFRPDEGQRRELAGGGAVRVLVDHPRRRYAAALTEDQARTIAAALRR